LRQGPSSIALPWRHGHCLADVREALAADGIGRKLASLRRPHVDAGEIPHGVVICDVAQPPQRHRARVAGPRGRLCVERRREPAEQLVPLGVARLRGLARRHVADVQPLDHMLEHRVPAKERLGRGEAGEIEVVVLGLSAVATPAGLHHERMDLGDVRLRQITLGRRGPGQNSECENERQTRRQCDREP
jgi:hypothetical protein